MIQNDHGSSISNTIQLILLCVLQYQLKNVEIVGQHECELRGCCFVAPSSCFYSSQAPQDLYLFGHGCAYSQALFEFTRLSSAIPLPPRCTFGVFINRYWAYAEYEERQLISEYIHHDVAVDVLVTDMEWHRTFYKLAENRLKD
jgi:alpha-glucosidase (family GH31 glycosyl hydrolase)